MAKKEEKIPRADELGFDSPRVLSIQSHVVSGYVGNKCAVFPLQVLGFEVDYINSVQFSNHTGYGNWKGQILSDKDLDDLYQGLVENELVNYTNILTGYVGSVSFLHQIKSVLTSIKQNNKNDRTCTYLCDPVLGDNGEFYVPEELIPVYKNDILPLADIVTPNTFELELLSDMKVKTEEDAIAAMDKLHKIGVKTVVLSSLDIPGLETLATYTSVRYKDGKRKVWKTTTEKYEGIYTGTGDLFSALFLGWYQKLGGADYLQDVLQRTLATMHIIIHRTKEHYDAWESTDYSHPQETPHAASTRQDKKHKPRELRLIQNMDVILIPPSTHPVTEVKI